MKIMQVQAILRSWSSRHKMLMFVVTAFLPTMSIIVFSGLQERQREIEAARNRALLIVQALAAQQEQVANSTRLMLSTLAQLPDIRRLDAEACNRLFADLSKQNPSYSVVAAATPDGNMIAASAPFIPGTVDLSDRKHIRDVIRTKDFSVGEYITDRISKDPSINYTYPVFDAHQNLIAIMIAGFKLDAFAHYVQKADLPENSAAAILDHKGFRLYCFLGNETAAVGSPVPAEAFRQISGNDEQGTYEIMAPDGIYRIYAFKQLSLRAGSQPYMYMTLGMEKDRITHAANVSMFRNLFILCASALLLMFLVWIYGKFVSVNPINRLVDDTRSLGNDKTLEPPPVRLLPGDELGQLASAFRQMKEDLKQTTVSKRYMDRITGNMLGLLIVAGQDGRIQTINPQVCEISGYKKETLLGSSIEKILFLSECEPLNIMKVLQLVNGVGRLQQCDAFLRDCKGKNISILLNISVMEDKDGNPECIVCSAMDITVRKQAVKALQAAEELYKNLATNSLTAFYIVQDRLFRFANPYLSLYSGYAEQDLLGMNSLSFVHPDDKEMVKAKAIRMLKGESKVPYEYRILDKKGQIKWVEETVSPIIYQGKRATLGSTMDITGRKKIEKDLDDAKNMLLQSEKLAAIGKLSAGVAHEILNPINILSMRLQLMEMMEALSDNALETLKICKVQIERIVKITREMGQFARITSRYMGQWNLNQIITDTLKISEPRLKLEGVTAKLNLCPDLPSSQVDKFRMEQVILNLLNNAVDAMQSTNTKVLNVTTKVILRRDQNFIQLIFSDTGSGIEPDHLNRLFEPFFTTKDPAKGTGLGLSICFGIIQDHGGAIRAMNVEGGGAAFFIELPCSQ